MTMCCVALIKKKLFLFFLLTILCSDITQMPISNFGIIISVTVLSSQQPQVVSQFLLLYTDEIELKWIINHQFTAGHQGVNVVYCFVVFPIIHTFWTVRILFVVVTLLQTP